MSVEKRRHERHTVTALCSVTVGGRDYTGTIVDASLSGMAVVFDDEIEAQPAPGTAVELNVERIGTVQAKFVRPRIDGIAVEFDALDAKFASSLFGV